MLSVQQRAGFAQGGVVYLRAPAAATDPAQNLFRRGVRPAGPARPEGAVRVPAMIEEAAARLGGGWRLARKLAGGLNQGAYLVRGPGGVTAVLKCYAHDPSRIAAAAPVIRAAREHGWPTPAWLAFGTTPSDGAWVLQEFASGQRPARLDEQVAALMVEV